MCNIKGRRRHANVIMGMVFVIASGVGIIGVILGMVIVTGIGVMGMVFVIASGVGIIGVILGMVIVIMRHLFVRVVVIDGQKNQGSHWRALAWHFTMSIVVDSMTIASWCQLAQK